MTPSHSLCSKIIKYNEKSAIPARISTSFLQIKSHKSKKLFHTSKVKIKLSANEMNGKLYESKKIENYYYSDVTRLKHSFAIKISDFHFLFSIETKFIAFGFWVVVGFFELTDLIFLLWEFLGTRNE